jgi:hypothetical protein
MNHGLHMSVGVTLRKTGLNMLHDYPHLQLRLNLRRELKFLISLILSLFAPIYGAERSMPLLRTATLTPNLSDSRGIVVAAGISSSERQLYRSNQKSDSHFSLRSSLQPLTN